MDVEKISGLMVLLAAGYVVFVWSLLRMAISGRSVEGCDCAPDPTPSPQRLDEDFFIEIASRFNETILANNDAADTVLFAILGATAAFIALAVDKIKELEIRGEHFALSLLAASVAVSLIGYVFSFFSRDGLEPESYVAEVTVSGKSAANAIALIELIERSRWNLAIRRWKRGLVLAAAVLLVFGAVMVAYARAGGGEMRGNECVCDAKQTRMVVR